MFGFIGLGNMGAPIARRIAPRHDLIVFDVRAGSSDECVRFGAVEAPTLDVLAARADEGYFLCVSDDEQVLDIVDDLLAQPIDQTGRKIIVLSTVAPTTIQGVALSAARRGVGVLEAPVSGNTEARESGRLTVFAGGTVEHLDELRPLLELFSCNIFHAGPVGAGAALKLANNVLAFLGVLGTAEAWELARAYGIPLEVLRTAVGVSTGDHYAMRNLEFIQKLYYEHPQGRGPDFYEFMRKDLYTALKAGDAVDINLYLTREAARVAPDVYLKFWTPENYRTVFGAGVPNVSG
ncbi:MAG: NAD(P)-dependent oxidoreductase [Mycetocola sp.]